VPTTVSGRSGLECRGQVLVYVVLVDDRGEDLDRARPARAGQVAHVLLVRDQTGELDAVRGLGRRVDDRRLEDRVPGLDVLHDVRRAGAADHEELVTARVLDRGEDADALVVVVVPGGVDLRRGLEQVGRRGLAALDGEVGGDAVVD